MNGFILWSVACVKGKRTYGVDGNFADKCSYVKLHEYQQLRCKRVWTSQLQDEFDFFPFQDFSNGMHIWNNHEL